MPKQIDSICVLRLSAIGDVCNAVAAVQAVQRRYPDASITWIIGKIEHQLLAGLPGIEFIIYDKAAGRQGIVDLKKQLKRLRFDVLLHMQVAMRANLLANMIRARRKIGYDWVRAKEGHSMVVSERISGLPKKAKRIHVLDSFMDFAIKLGVDSEDCYPPRWDIPVSKEDQDFALQHIPENQHFLIICPAASKEERCSSPELYAAVAHYASRRGLRTILCGGPGELDQTLAKQICEQSKIEIRNLVGQTSLKQMFALLGRASIVLAPDTGPAHMANAQGTPVVGLYAHSNPRRTGPYNYPHLVVNAYDSHLEQQTGKSHDQLRWGHRVKGRYLMSAITQEQVFDKIDQALLELKA
jgi:heptosyltransferase I